MKLLVILNNHNSFAILDLCVELKRQEPAIEVVAVCCPEFLAANAGPFAKRSISPEILDIHTAATTPPSTMLSGIKVLEARVRDPGVQGGSGKLGRAATVMVKAIISTSAYSVAREWVITKRLKLHQKRAGALLAWLKPDVVLSMSDRSHDYVEGAILWAARAAGIGIVLPYVAQFDVEASLQYRLGSDGKPLAELRPFWPFSLYKLWTFRLLRSQVYNGIFFQTPFVLNAARRCGTLSSYPWWVGNGLSDVVCVDSQHTAEEYAKHRVARNKITIVGHVQYDNIFRSYQQRSDLRKRLVGRYALGPEKALLVLSVPQYAEQGFLPWPEHWREVDSIVAHASSAGQNLLLSLHPRSDASRYGYLAERFGCSILSEPLADIIGAADVFLASNSTTLVWSVLCGIPTIALKSPVRFLYAYLPSIRRVDDTNILPGVIRDILTGPQPVFDQDWQLLSRDRVFDGQYNQRFITLLRQAGTSRLGDTRFQ